MNSVTTGVQCSTCAEIKHLGLHNEHGCINSLQLWMELWLQKMQRPQWKQRQVLWLNYTMHAQCIVNSRSPDERIIKSMESSSQAKFAERHKEDTEATEMVFHTACECARSYLPSPDYYQLAVGLSQCSVLSYLKTQPPSPVTIAQFSHWADICTDTKKQAAACNAAWCGRSSQ